MKLLLDTHTLLWFIMGNANLSANARALIEDQTNEKFLSVASLWEIAIKVSIGKLTLSTSVMMTDNLATIAEVAIERVIARVAYDRRGSGVAAYVAFVDARSQ